MSFIRLTDIVRRTWTEFQARKCFFSPKIELVHFGTKCRLKAVTLNLAIYIYQLDHLRKKHLTELALAEWKGWQLHFHLSSRYTS